ncbi:MAG: type II toxin-antitoxin system PemK/MazF family toxin [Candidatus Velthaea sp.]
MPLPPGIFPEQRDVWMCDYAGYEVPEMVKTRRVIIVSPRNSGARVALVVPVSTSGPGVESPVHVRLPGRASYPCFSGVDEVWAKCDLVSHVRFARLSRVRVNDREIHTVKISPTHFKQVQEALLRSFGLGRITGYL